MAAMATNISSDQLRATISEKDALGSAVKWHVLHTRSRQERAVAASLLSAGIRVYLPAVRKTMFYGHRKRVVLFPLFPSYVFMKGDVEATYMAISTKRVAHVIAVYDQCQFAHELEQIRRAIESNQEFMPVPAIEAGTAVRVTRGPLKDVEGIVEFRRLPGRLVLQIETLGRATSLEIDEDLLEPLN